MLPAVVLYVCCAYKLVIFNSYRIAEPDRMIKNMFISYTEINLNDRITEQTKPIDEKKPKQIEHALIALFFAIFISL